MALWPFGRKAPDTSFPPEVQRIFDKVVRFLDDEAAQNSALPEDFRQVLGGSPSCDYVPNAFGDFGRMLTSPVPVNGPVGELVYLSRLEMADGGAIAFHRLGAFDKVDVFEVVSENGRHWDVLYLSLYFARKSKQVPSGYRMMTDKARRNLIRGTTLYVDGFPKGAYAASLECTKRMVSIPIGDTRLKSFDARNDLVRPRTHLEALSKLKFTSKTAAPTDGGRPSAREGRSDGPQSDLSSSLPPLTESCVKLADPAKLFQVADKMTKKRSAETDNRAPVLSLILMGAAGHFVAETLQWEEGAMWRSSRQFLRNTNLDVITAETIVWMAFLMGQLWKADAKRDREMFERIGHVTTATAGRLALGIVKDTTGVDFERRARESRTIYLDALKYPTVTFEPFASVLLRSVGCQSLSDPLKPIGPLPPAEWTPLTLHVGTFYSTMQSGSYDTFKNFLREWSDRFPHDEDI